MFLPDHFQFYSPVKTNSGKNALDHIPVELDALGANRPFLITSKEISKKGLVRKVINAFQDSGLTIGIYDGIDLSSNFNTVKELASLYKGSGCNALIALGTGIITDIVKILSWVISEGSDDIDRFLNEGNIEHTLIPMILLHTSSGNGYETSGYATLEGKQFSSPYFMPNNVVIDPRIFQSDSLMSIASGAMVALTHSVESYIGPSKNPVSDAYAYTAMNHFVPSLKKVIEKTMSKEARIALTNSEAIAGCVFSNSSPGTTHILGEQLAKQADIPAGVFMGILLPYVLNQAIKEDNPHIKDLLLPIGGDELYAVSDEALKAPKVVSILRELCFMLHRKTKGEFPETLKSAGISKELLESIAKDSAEHKNCKLDVNSLIAILENAWDGNG